jgi:hypothetical protein
MPLSGAAESLALGVSSAISVSNAETISTAAFRKSAEIVKDARLNLAAARATLRRHAKEVIYGAFPAASRHQTCVQAAMACGTSPDTILRLLEGDTAAPDVLVLGYCARVYRDRTGKVTPIHSVIAQVIAAEVFA